MVNEKGHYSFRPENEIGERAQMMVPMQHLARDKIITYYTGGGDTAMGDGLLGSWYGNSPTWQGTLGYRDYQVCDFEVDLEKPTDISEIYCEFLLEPFYKAYPPRRVVILGSNDQKTYDTISDESYEEPKNYRFFEYERKGWKGYVTYRYIRYQTYGFRLDFTDSYYHFISEFVIH